MSSVWILICLYYNLIFPNCIVLSKTYRYVHKWYWPCRRLLSLSRYELFSSPTSAIIIAFVAFAIPLLNGSPYKCVRNLRPLWKIINAYSNWKVTCAKIFHYIFCNNTQIIEKLSEILCLLINVKYVTLHCKYRDSAKMNMAVPLVGSNFKTRPASFCEFLYCPKFR